MAASNMLARLKRGAGGQALTQATRMLVLLTEVPVLLYFWGPQLFGEWLIITAIPQYLGMSDLGFAQAAVREMTMSMGRDDKAEALSIFQSCWVLTLLLSTLVMAAMAATALALPLASLFQFQHIQGTELPLMLSLLALGVLCNIQVNLMSSGLTCTGQYGECFTFLAITRLAEYFVMLGAIALGGDPLTAIWVQLVARFAILAGFWLFVRKRVQWLKYGIQNARWSQAKALFVPATAALGLQLCMALNFQGIRLVIGYVLGPAAVVVFATMRTVTRIASQVLMSLSRIIIPEMGSAFGRKDIAEVRKIHRKACQLSLWLATAAAVCIAFAGEFFLELWTGGRVDVDKTTLIILVAVTVLNAFWFTSFSIQMASNTHAAFTRKYILLNVVLLAFSLALTHWFGLPGAATGLLFIEAGMIYFVLPSSLSRTGDDFKPFLSSVARPPTFLYQVLIPGRSTEGKA